MSETEFVPDGAQPDGAQPDGEHPDETPAPPPPSGRRGLVPAVFWLLAAGFSIAAPFGDLYSTKAITFTDGTVRQSVDGWGRYGFGSTDANGPRYGIVFCVAAALFLGAAVLVFIRRVGPPIRIGVVLIAIGAIAAGAGFVAVQFTSLSDSLATETSASAGTPPPITHATVGSCLWLLLAGVACAVVGLALDVLSPDPLRGPRTDDQVRAE